MSNLQPITGGPEFQPLRQTGTLDLGDINIDPGVATNSNKFTETAKKQPSDRGPTSLSSLAKTIMKVVTTPPAAAAALGGGIIAGTASIAVGIPIAIGAGIGFGIGMGVDKYLQKTADQEKIKAGDLGEMLRGKTGESAIKGAKIGAGVTAAAIAVPLLPIIAVGFIAGAAAFAGGFHIYANVAEKVDMGMAIKSQFLDKEYLVKEYAMQSLDKDPGISDAALKEKVQIKFRGLGISDEVLDKKIQAGKDARAGIIRESETPLDESMKMAGGHEGAFKPTGDGYIRKQTSENEVNLYSLINEDPAFAKLKEITPKARNFVEKTVEMQDLREGFKKEGRIILDIKIGESTYEGSVNKVRSPDTSTWAKSLWKSAADRASSRSFRVIQGEGNLDRAIVESNSKEYIQSAIRKYPQLKDDLVKQLEIIQKALIDTPVVFYGQSVLIVMGEKDGKPAFEMKLIDIGNYVTQKEASDAEILNDYYKLQKNTLEGIRSLISLIKYSE